MINEKLTIDDIQVEECRVLLRVDFNVPLSEGRVADDTRLVATLPTLASLRNRGARLVMMSHLGRPKGSVVPELSLRPVASRLAELVSGDVTFADNCVGDEAEQASRDLAAGEMLLLENVRFHGGEEANDPDFAGELAGLGDLYVNDAFGTAHRAHASTVGVAEHFDVRAAGYLMAKELEYLGGALKDPRGPFVAVLGGAKISGKIDVIAALRGKVDHLLIGGGMAFTFLAAMGHEVGRSLVEDERLELALKLMEAAPEEGATLNLPVDVMVAAELKKDVNTAAVSVERIPADMAGYDIGPETVRTWSDLLKRAATIVWNGPMGVFEVPPFDAATKELALVIAEATDAGATSIIGGGDSAAAVAAVGMSERMSHVSTGGGASLEFLEGKELPGVLALSDRD